LRPPVQHPHVSDSCTLKSGCDSPSSPALVTSLRCMDCRAAAPQARVPQAGHQDHLQPHRRCHNSTADVC
jgi:hypothetical protein